MIPDYFTNYKYHLEQYEAVLNLRIGALATFIEAVNLDWETVRTTKALSHVCEIKTQVEEVLKRQAQEATLSEVTRRLPGDLPTLFPIVGRIIASLIPEDIPSLRPRTSDERLVSAFLQNPRNASLLLGAIDNVLKEIQTKRVPEGKNATAYVDQRLREELGEALRKLDSSPSRPKYFTPA